MNVSTRFIIYILYTIYSELSIKYKIGSKLQKYQSLLLLFGQFL